MTLDPVTTIAVVEAGLRLGLQAYEQAQRLSAEGYEVPGLDEFERGTDQLRALPDLTPKDKEAGD